MAHWAEIDENNIVLRVLITDNNEPDEGYQWLIDNLGGTWVQTSYNTKAGVHQEGGTPLRKNFAGIGYTYDSMRDAFIAPKPELPEWAVSKREWVLNEEACVWELHKIPFE